MQKTAHIAYDSEIGLVVMRFTPFKYMYTKLVQVSQVKHKSNKFAKIWILLRNDLIYIPQYINIIV